MRIEIRTCIKCGEDKEITQRHAHSNNICGDCSRKSSREYQQKAAIIKGRRIGINGRYPYPLEGIWAYPNQKFNAIAKKLKYILKREDWIMQIRINLDETINNPLVMQWIKSTRYDEQPKKKRSTIIKDYPDTRNISWEEWEKLGFGTEEDN